MLRRAPQAASLFLLLATLSLSNDGACDVLSAAPSPRIHIYDVPTDFTQPKLWFGVTRLLPYLRESKASSVFFSAQLFWLFESLVPCEV